MGDKDLITATLRRCQWRVLQEAAAAYMDTSLDTDELVRTIEAMLSDSRTPKLCPIHADVEQVGIYCNRPMGSRLVCGERLHWDC